MVALSGMSGSGTWFPCEPRADGSSSSGELEDTKGDVTGRGSEGQLFLAETPDGCRVCHEAGHHRGGHVELRNKLGGMGQLPGLLHAFASVSAFVFTFVPGSSHNAALRVDGTNDVVINMEIDKKVSGLEDNREAGIGL